MAAIYILIPIAIAFTAVGLYIFFWAVKSDQFDDLDKQGLSILFDDKDIETNKPQTNKLQSEISQTSEEITKTTEADHTLPTQQQP